VLRAFQRLRPRPTVLRQPFSVSYHRLGSPEGSPTRWYNHPAPASLFLLPVRNRILFPGSSGQPGLRPPARPTTVHAPSRSADQQKPFRIRPGRIASPHPLPSRQFQALFDSLFKVLFIFPSRYLFAIGLSPVFSLGRRLRVLCCALPVSLRMQRSQHERSISRQAAAQLGRLPLRVALSRMLLS